MADRPESLVPDAVIPRIRQGETEGFSTYLLNLQHPPPGVALGFLPQAPMYIAYVGPLRNFGSKDDPLPLFDPNWDPQRESRTIRLYPLCPIACGSLFHASRLDSVVFQEYLSSLTWRVRLFAAGTRNSRVWVTTERITELPRWTPVLLAKVNDTTGFSLVAEVSTFRSGLEYYLDNCH